MTLPASPGEGDDEIILVHLSDLHVGTRLLTSSDDFGRVSGYHPHDARLLRLLDAALRDVRARFRVPAPERLNVVISGDLTQAGLDNDFATVSALLYNQWQWRLPPKERTLGFGWSRDQVMTVPGNHDHWGEARVAFRPELTPAFFEVTPWPRELKSLAGTFRLELYGIDSNSGLSDPARPARGNPFAGGAVAQHELDSLEDLLKAREFNGDGAPVLRALVCHHAMSPDGLFNARPLDDESRVALQGIAGRHGICAALTGHTHRFHVEDYSTPEGGVLKELRCAATLQATRGRGFQGFWVHQIMRRRNNAECQWLAWKYQRAASSFDINLVEPVSFTVALRPPA